LRLGGFLGGTLHESDTVMAAITAVTPRNGMKVSLVESLSE
jgi:hypothetical protein